MSNKKDLKSIKDENQDLQKQMGCISGFFLLFDRHWFLNKASPGGTSNDVKELNNKMQKAAEKNVKTARENQQFSTESSVTSMSSSSCSSSMSSLEFNRTIQVNTPSIIQIKIPENSNSGASVKQLDTPYHQSIDFYDVVKDSLHREPQGLSMKTHPKEEKKGRILKHIDSPRPFQAAKSCNAGVLVTNEPFFIPAKSRKIPWDSPRHSYDERDIEKVLTKHKEIARLSLDGKEATKSHNLLKAAQKEYASSSTMLRQQQEPETSRRPSSVVAKLMGLDAFPESTQTCDTPPRMSSCGINRIETSAKSSMSDGYNQNQSPVSSVTSKGSILVKSRKDYVSISNVSQEDSQLQVSKGSESSSIKSSNPALSLYGQIEKRVADLQFKNSGKDLRALKHILEAMQKYKDSLDIPKEQASNYQSDRSLNESSKSESPRRSQKDPTHVPDEIVIIKPARIATKTNNPDSKDLLIHDNPSHPTKGISPTIRKSFHHADKSNKMRTSKLMQSSKIPQDFTETADTRSPRVQKKFGLERRSLTTPSSDSNNNRRQLNQSLESSSPSTTPRKKASTLQQRNERFSCQRVSDFDGNRSMDSHSDTETIQVNHSEKNNNSISNCLNGLNQNNVTKELSKDSYMAETTVTAEQPSPVSVLDAAFYIEDPPSPVKKKLEISQDLDEVLTAYDSGEEIADLPLLSSTRKANFRNGTYGNDFQTQNLVQILQQIDYNDHKFINSLENKDPDHEYISEILVASQLLSNPSSSHAAHSSDHPINPKLFLALEQIKSNKTHFNVEQDAKMIAKMNYLEKMQRKLIFDSVNDILLQKLIMESSSTLWCLKNQPTSDHKLNGQKLFDELCRKMDELQHKNRNVSLASEDENLTSLLWEDLMHYPAIWTECKGEIPYIVLDIERLIFKDLITEVVRDEVANYPGRHCRQLLFPM